MQHRHLHAYKQKPTRTTRNSYKRTDKTGRSRATLQYAQSKKYNYHKHHKVDHAASPLPYNTSHVQPRAAKPSRVIIFLLPYLGLASRNPHATVRATRSLHWDTPCFGLASDAPMTGWEGLVRVDPPSQSKEFAGQSVQNRGAAPHLMYRSCAPVAQICTNACICHSGIAPPRKCKHHTTSQYCALDLGQHKSRPDSFHLTRGAFPRVRYIHSGNNILASPLLSAKDTPRVAST
jgi:hypothetical protein